ncbi:MAG TPA: hypothetical protein VG651_00375 [Stellaceae bacterium]|nr:hypothetical protein [Stellaceae bacterium]
MSAFLVETALELEERHIVRLETLITKQEILLASLKARGHSEAAILAERVLDNANDLLEFAVERRTALLNSPRRAGPR